ncbi:MAG: hypothetical protein H7A06_09695 [Pseudomonadales bacterium]|nr:hypothetical protein [Pseudomonadales bacterium]
MSAEREMMCFLYKSNSCAFLLSEHAERMQKERRLPAMNLKFKWYPHSAFVQAALAQFLGCLKGQKPSGFLRKLHDLHPEFVPQPVGQMATSLSCLWSAKPEPRSTTRFAALTGSTKLEGPA